MYLLRSWSISRHIGCHSLRWSPWCIMSLVLCTASSLLLVLLAMDLSFGFSPRMCPVTTQCLLEVLRCYSMLLRCYTVNIQDTFQLHTVIYSSMVVHVCVYVYTGCHRRNGPNFGRVFLRSNYLYTDITQNTYIQSSMVMEILNIEKRGLVWCLRTVLCPWRHTRRIRSCIPMLSLDAAHCDLGYGSDARSV